MLISFIIFAAALFVDGATDCANAVTGAVSSKALTLRTATRLSAVCTFLGCIVFCIFFPRVAENSAAVTFPEGLEAAATAISLLSVALWSGAAWVLGLPTSEGHALVAASAGAALAFGGDVEVPRLLFAVLSILPAALFGILLSLLFARVLRGRRDASFRTPIVLSALVSSFFHGAQDGQKFLSLALAASLAGERYTAAALAAALFMALGTLFGGRIIRKMGSEMVVCDKTAALSCDLGGSLALAILTALGIPASTTHVRMTSLAAATRALGGKTDKGTFALLCTAWIATFPVAFAVSFSISKLFFVMFL